VACRYVDILCRLLVCIHKLSKHYRQPEKDRVSLRRHNHHLHHGSYIFQKFLKASFLMVWTYEVSPHPAWPGLWFYNKLHISGNLFLKTPLHGIDETVYPELMALSLSVFFGSYQIPEFSSQSKFNWMSFWQQKHVLE